jgi:hypothetical protein
MEPIKSEQGQVVEDLTYDQLSERVGSDPSYANALLEGRLNIEKAPEPVSAPAPSAETPAPAAAPAVPAPAVAPVVAPVAEEPFVVEMPDGSKITYRNPNEGKKALREKELFIRKQKEIIADFQARESENARKLEELKKAPIAAPATSTPPAVAPKAEEKLDVFSEDYLKNLSEKLQAQENAIRQLEEKHKQELDDFRRRDDEREKRANEDAAVRRQFFAANQFMHAHPEFKMDEPVESVDEKYRNFLRDLGMVAGTDGSSASNANAAQLYFDGENAEGKAIKEKAEAHGIRPPAGTDKYLALARVINESRRLKRFDPDLQKEVPFTLDQTFSYLQALGEGVAPKAPAGQESTPPPAPAVRPDAPMAAAFKAAEALKQSVATDIPPGASGAAVDVATMNDTQKLEVVGWEAKDIRNNPIRRDLLVAVYKAVGQVPPRWATEEAKPSVSKPLFKG